MILIDHQVGAIGWIGSIGKATVEAYALALEGVALSMSQEDQLQGPLMPGRESTAPEAFARGVC